MRWTVTSALPYVNNIPHLGNMAGSVLPADVFSRFLRLKGEDVIFICGTDEHGTPITVAAMKEGLTPRQLADKYFVILRDLYLKMDMAFDNFGRTTYPDHYPLTQEFFLKLLKNGYVSKKTMKLPYCPDCKMFLPDRYVEGQCPNCGFTPARGDQCDKCGKLLDPTELINPYCVTCKSKPELRETFHWFLDLPKLAPKLEAWIKSSEHWSTDAKNTALGFIKGGLESRCITRDLDWGVPVPLEEGKKKVLYVWFDAPIGYISSTIEWARRIGKPNEWKKYWKEEDTRIVHFLGKDNLIFHTIIWPGMLIGVGDYMLPHQVIGLQWLNWEGGKFSKSRGVGIFLDDAVNMYPADYWRYTLVALAPQTKDSDFTWDEFLRRVNGELNDVLGNFVHRVLTYVRDKMGNKVPKGTLDPDVSKQITNAFDKVGKAMFAYDQKGALSYAMDLARFGNQYLNQKEPWKNPSINDQVLFNCCQIVANLSVLLYPFIPSSCTKIRSMLGIKKIEWKQATVSAGTQLGKIEQLFQRTSLKDINAKLEEARRQGEPKIKYDDFAKVKLKVAKVISAEDVPGTKLVKLQVDLGKEKRQIIAGIGKCYKAKGLVGKLIVVVANLEPRKLRGETSDGMLLAAGTEDNLSLLVLDKDIAPGSEIS